MNYSVNIRWYEENKDGDQFSITYLQLYLAKCNTSLKVSRVTFYLLQVYMMRLSNYAVFPV